MFRALTVTAVLLLTAANVFAQDDPCTVAVPPYVVSEGLVFKVLWNEPSKVPKSDTDPTLVDHVIEGFTYSLNGGPMQDMSPPPTKTTCPDGRWGYVFQAPPVTAGSYTVVLQAWNTGQNGARQVSLLSAPATFTAKARAPLPVSPDCTSVLVGSASTIVDAAGNVWGIDPTGKAIRNGAWDGALLSEILWAGGKIYVRGGPDPANWYSWTSGSGYVGIGTVRPACGTPRLPAAPTSVSVRS